MIKISKTKAVEIIKSTSSKYMTVKNITKDGRDRTYKSSKYNMDMHGNLNVLTKDGYRNIRPETIFYLKFKQEYAVV